MQDRVLEGIKLGSRRHNRARLVGRSEASVASLSKATFLLFPVRLVCVVQ